MNEAIHGRLVGVVVILLTPPDRYRNLGKRILSAGKHLVIEKPAGL